VEIRRQYHAHVQRMLQLTGQNEAVAARGAEAVVALETDLAKASLTPVEKRDPYNLLHRMTRAELQSLTPAFDWNAYLAGMGLNEVDEINVMEPAFYRELDRLIRQRDLADWQSYLRWQLTNARAPGLSSAFVAADFDFYRRTLRGVPTDMPRWKKCVRGVDRDLGEALGQVFVARTFSADTRARTLEMTHRIEVAMEQEINALPWMSAETKARALEKLHTIVNKVGYPDTWRDYSALDVKPGDFAGNLRRATVFESRRQLAKIGQPVDRGEWGMTPPTVNAYYNPQMNDINFPAGVLQPPLYDPAMDDAPNYGNTGSTIGHELTHGFDDEGRQFDARGNLKDWWKKADAQGFDERLQCVQEQYAEYVVVDDIRINSKLTSGEDVADLGGTLLAYIAWQAATSGMTLAPIDGFSPEQRFFIGLGQWACENDRPENLRVSASTDPHSPGRYRINGVVANMPEFQKAFACKAGQPMVREKPCRIW
jgi:putative endopeptidase